MIGNAIQGFGIVPLRSETSITHHILKILLFILAIASSLSSQTVYVPASHWVYDFLDRMEAGQSLRTVLGNTRPMTRQEIVSHLKQLIDNEQDFDRVTRDQLDYLRFEFMEELNLLGESAYSNPIHTITKSRFIDPWLPDFIYPRGRHLLEIEHGPLRVNWDPILDRSRLVADDDSVAERERVNIDSNGFLLWGTIGQHVGFYTDVRDSREWGTRAYPVGNSTAPRLGFVQGNGRQIYHDETIAYLFLQWRYFGLLLGKDVSLWGPGKSGQLMLSDNATSYDQIKLQMTLKRLKLTSLIAWLRAYSPAYYLNETEGRMMAAHRLEFSPFRFIDLGIQETVIYSGRKFEPAYANPVMFFRSAEHYLGDHDNVAMGLDVEFKLIPKTKVYGELFIDDLTTGKLGTDFYGNKYGTTTGFHHINLLNVPQLDIRCEYTRLRPFTYSHKNSLTSYYHFTTILGHWIGPNADILLGDLSYRFSYRTLFRIQIERLRQGENTPLLNVGGDANIP
ncbi:MAG: hypothetical protein EHM72_12310, partial [Calditrichaeota bacterium]